MTKQLAARQKETSHIYPQQYQNDQASMMCGKQYARNISLVCNRQTHGQMTSSIIYKVIVPRTAVL